MSAATAQPFNPKVTIAAVIKIPTNMSILFMRELSLRPKDKYGPRPKGIRAQTRGHGDFEMRNSEKGGFEGFECVNVKKLKMTEPFFGDGGLI